jgi:hypothetical protein
VEQARAWTNHNNDFVSLFYDGHNCFTTLLAGDREDNFFHKEKTTFVGVFIAVLRLPKGYPTVPYHAATGTKQTTFLDRVPIVRYSMLAKVGSGSYLEIRRAPLKIVCNSRP